MAAAGRPVAAHERLVVAVSGGPDSIGLLAEAHRAFAGRVVALTVDHGLRAASASEADAVLAQCAARDIRHVTLRWVGDKPAANVQAAARAARYRLMLQWCRTEEMGILLTAHHTEDQAETLVMRLARGSGSAGLAGVRPLRREPDVDIVRPLLATSRVVLARWAEGWDVIHDPGNTDYRYARTGVRDLLVREAELLPAAALAASAAHLLADDKALAWVTEQAWAGRAARAGDALLLDLQGLPDALRMRMVAKALTEIVPLIELRGADVMRLIARLDSGRSATLCGLKIEAIAGLNPVWKFSNAPARRGTKENQEAK